MSDNIPQKPKVFSEKRIRYIQTKIFFFHIAKTAGSAFNTFLGNYFAGKDHCQQYLSPDGLFANLEQLKQLDYLSGHFKYCVFERNGFNRDDYCLVTFIRNPISQLLSHLNWVIHIYDISPKIFYEHPKLIQNISLELRALDLYKSDSFIYALNNFQGLFRNNQARYFADYSEKLDKDAVLQTMCQLDMIGITEHYDESVRRFAQLNHLAIDGTPQPIVNRNLNYRVGAEILENPLINEFLQEYNQIDIQMYDYFYSRFIRGLGFHQPLAGVPSQTTL